jgi:hypothetical protein
VARSGWERALITLGVALLVGATLYAIAMFAFPSGTERRATRETTTTTSSTAVPSPSSSFPATSRATPVTTVAPPRPYASVAVRRPQDRSVLTPPAAPTTPEDPCASGEAYNITYRFAFDAPSVARGSSVGYSLTITNASEHVFDAPYGDGVVTVTYVDDSQSLYGSRPALPSDCGLFSMAPHTTFRTRGTLSIPLQWDDGLALSTDSPPGPATVSLSWLSHGIVPTDIAPGTPITIDPAPVSATTTTGTEARP